MLPVVVYKSAGFLITDKTLGIKSVLIKVTDVSLFKQFIETRNSVELCCQWALIISMALTYLLNRLYLPKHHWISINIWLASHRSVCSVVGHKTEGVDLTDYWGDINEDWGSGGQ